MKYPGKFICNASVRPFYNELVKQGRVKKSVNSDLPLVSGLVPGCVEHLRSGKDFINFDRGYFHHFIQDGKGESVYFRLVYNYLWHDTSGNFSNDRMIIHKIPFRDWQTTGDKIAVVLPDEYHCKIFNINPKLWLKKIVEKIKQYSDRKIVISHRKIQPVYQIYKDLHCVVSFHSNCWLHALILGIPVITTCKYRKIGSIEQIENPPRERSFIKNFFYYQWTMEQFKSGQAWSEFCEMNDENTPNKIEDSCESFYHAK